MNNYIASLERVPSPERLSTIQGGGLGLSFSRLVEKSDGSNEVPRRISCGLQIVKRPPYLKKAHSLSARKHITKFFGIVNLKWQDFCVLFYPAPPKKSIVPRYNLPLKPTYYYNTDFDGLSRLVLLFLHSSDEKNLFKKALFSLLTACYCCGIVLLY